MSRTAGNFDGLPLFASEDAISLAFLGPGKTQEWKQIATLLEGRGLPRIDALMGGRASNRRPGCAPFKTA